MRGKAKRLQELVDKHGRDYAMLAKRFGTGRSRRAIEGKVREEKWGVGTAELDLQPPHADARVSGRNGGRIM